MSACCPHILLLLLLPLLLTHILVPTLATSGIRLGLVEGCRTLHLLGKFLEGLDQLLLREACNPSTRQWQGGKRQAYNWQVATRAKHADTSITRTHQCSHCDAQGQCCPTKK
jgi:hypothetical protein